MRRIPFIKHRHEKLTWDQRDEIAHKYYCRGIKQKDLAIEYNVSANIISRTVNKMYYIKKYERILRVQNTTKDNK